MEFKLNNCISLIIICLLTLLRIEKCIGQLGFEIPQSGDDSGNNISSDSDENSSVNSLNSISIECPVRCLCFHTTVRCMFLHLEKIPHVPIDTTILDLRFNRIREIPKNSFTHLVNLDTLLLNNNHITRLGEGVFNGLSRLKFLYLYKNRIRDIHPRAFDGLQSLEQLYLHQNIIQDIDSSTFSNLPNLERLFLQNNHIQRIPPGTFKDLHNMKRLRLDSNSLICDCSMLELAQMLVDHPGTLAAATCQQPLPMQGKPITALHEMKLECRKPVITEEPRDVQVNFGNTVYFTCKAEGNPQPRIVWLRNQNEINTINEPRYSVLQDGTLMIANAQDEDAGVYECMAKSMVGETKSRVAKMEYKKSQNRIRPRFTKAPKDTQIREGESFKLNCSASGIPKPNITWFLNDRELVKQERHKVSDSYLQINPIGKEDEGIYRCTATNALGAVSTIADVRIIVPPVWIQTPIDQTVQNGGILSLNCEAVGKPVPKIIWTHNGQLITRQTSEQDPRIVLMDEGGKQLIVKSIKPEDDGEYGCKAENTAGSLEITANIKVVSGSAPIFTTNPTDYSTTVGFGRQVRLACTASGMPKPLIIWKKNGHTMIETSKITILPEGTLIINRFNPLTDSGTYECTAFNDHGVIRTDPIRIDSNGGVRVVVGNDRVLDDSIILSAITQARFDVEKAENESLEILFGNMAKMEFRTPFDLLQLSRFPRAEARDIVRSAEIYERALQIIWKHAQEMNFTTNGEFSYNDLLSSTQLETLGRFSGCISHRKPKSNCSQEMCFHSKYRSIDGSCNNLAEPMWGNSYVAFQRLLPPVYENGFNLPIGWIKGKLYNGYPKPLARVVSSQIIRTEHISQDTNYTHMIMQWGQFLDHDLDHALPSLSIESFGERISCRRTCQNVPPCFPMETPENDLRVRSRKCMEFTRSAAVCGSGMTSILYNTIQQREQINELTSFIDASQVYGSSVPELRFLQSKTEKQYLRKGIYMYPNKPLMPFATDETPIDCRRNFRESDVGCFLGGDIRVNEQLGLLAMHTIWFRQHNVIADKLKAINPTWEDEIIFQETRKIVGAQMQHITYAHWLPLIIGKRGMELMREYKGYDPKVNPTITTEFATAALRFGHTLINPVLRRLDQNFQTIREGDLQLRNSFFAPWRLVEEGGVDPVLRGLFTVAAKLKKPQELLNSHLTEDLFSHAHLVALDLAAMNIQRGRDHGLPSYNEYRAFCGLPKASSFDDLKNQIPNEQLRRDLEFAYKHVDNIDLWVGGISEEPEDPDARVGPTFRCILIDQFKRLRDGDRFWYENPSTFRPEQLIEIKQTTLSSVLCETGDSMTHVKKDVFLMDSELLNCQQIRQPQFSLWAANCCGRQDERESTFNQATCPILHYSHSHFSPNTETNLIQGRRRRRETQLESNNNEETQLSKLQETLESVNSTVTTLKQRIEELERKCEKEGN